MTPIVEEWQEWKEIKTDLNIESIAGSNNPMKKSSKSIANPKKIKAKF